MERSAPLALSRRLPIAALLLALAVPVEAAEPLLLARDRPSPQRLEEAAAHPVYNAALKRFLSKEADSVALAHAGGAEGSAWAAEVRDWLVTLGVPGSSIRMEPGVTEAGLMRIRVGGDSG